MDEKTTVMHQAGPHGFDEQVLAVFGFYGVPDRASEVLFANVLELAKYR